MSIDPSLERRGFLKCMTWAGTAMVWTVAAGVPRSRLIGSAEAATTDFTFVQLSDSHLGFDKPANPNVTATLQEALDDVGKLPKKPEASTTFWRRKARATSTASARAPRAMAGTASTPAASTSSAWSTW